MQAMTWKPKITKRIKLVKEEDICLCQVCGYEIEKGRIFCQEHNTTLNRQIYEIFSEFPFAPRGEKLYYLISLYLAARFNLINERRFILKSSSGVGKSFLMDMIAFIELTHFHNSMTIIGSVGDEASKEHIQRLRQWIGHSVFGRYITGSRDATASKTEIKLAKINSRIKAMPQAEKTRCVSSNTELLTLEGWKQAAYIKSGDIVLTWNKDEDELQWEAATKSTTVPYNGKMIQFESHAVDMLVTPNHRIVCKTSKNWLVKQASELSNMYRFLVPFAAKKIKGELPLNFRINNKLYPIIPFLELLGYYISEGNIDGNRICISQGQSSTYRVLIEKCIKLLGYPIKYREKSRQYRFSDMELAKWLKENCGTISDNKKLPKFIYTLDSSLIKVFLESYLNGDADKRQRVASTKSRDLADGIQALWLLIGKSGSISKHKGREIFEIYPKMQFKQGIIWGKQIKTVDFDGYISCIEVPNSFLVYRYNSKISISGNTGWHPTLLLIDEIGRMRKAAYYGSFFQMGRTTNVIEILASTPYLDSIAMQDIWNSKNVVRLSLEREDCWWIGSKFLSDIENSNLPPEMKEQLFEGKFRSISNRVIDDDLLLRSIESGQHPPSSRNLIMGVDFGKARDPTAVVLLDSDTGDIKFAQSFELKEDWNIQFKRVRDYYKRFKPSRIIADSSSMGDVIITANLIDLPIEPISMQGGPNKRAVINKLRMAFLNGKINIVEKEFPELVNQLSFYVYTDQHHLQTGSISHIHDDLVDALALAIGAMDISDGTTLYDTSVWDVTGPSGSSGDSFFRDLDVDDPFDVDVL